MKGTTYKESEAAFGEGVRAVQVGKVENKKVFISGIPLSVHRDELNRILEVFAAAVDFIIMMDQQWKGCRAIGIFL
jgi:hypothetical protein